RPGETVVDATFGAGGHASLLAADLRGRGKLIAIDRDPGARVYFDRLAKRAGVQTRFLRGDFSVVLEQLAGNDGQADAILLDQGGDSGSCPLWRRSSRQARVPGAPDCRQRRARLPRGRAAVRVLDAAARWPARGDQLPFARGSDRQALHARSRTRLRVSARLPGLRV